MIYIENSAHDPAFNQAFEEYVFDSVQTDETILILWRNAPAVVCGCYQNVFAEVNAVRAREQDVAVIRRISGGGTVYHDMGNVNYTYIAPVPKGGDGVNYARFIRPVTEALNRLGIPARMNRTCDIAVNGLKVSGSAQKVAKGRVLHHGTLLYDTDLTALRALADGRRDKFSAKGIASTPWPVANMRGCLAADAPDTEGFEARLRTCLAGDARTVMLPQAELNRVRALAADKYQSWDWTFARSPAFECRTAFLLGALPAEMRYRAKKGIIEAIEFDVSLPVLDAAAERLTGAALKIDEIREKLKGLDGLEGLDREIF